MKTLVNLISFLAIMLVILAGPLYQLDIVTLGNAFTALSLGVYVGIAALVLLAIQIIFMRQSINWLTTGISIVCLIVAVGLPVSLKNKAKSVPPIHDISTDLVNPPKFIAIAQLRKNAPNPAEYAGEETAKQQTKAYPELTTQKYTQTTEQLMNVTEAAILDLGWDLVNLDKSAGIIEATDTTLWFGFKDDVIVRITDIKDQRLLDVRSKSRIGKSDVGKNAERIHSLIDNINANIKINYAQSVK